MTRTSVITHLMCTRVRFIPVPRLRISLLICRDMNHHQLRTLLQRIRHLRHSRNPKLPRRIIHSNERIPLSHHERFLWVDSKSASLACSIERVAVAERDDAKGIASTDGRGMEVAIGYGRVEVAEVFIGRFGF